MKAMITGASSGIGRDMAKILSDKSYDLILVARNKEALETLKKELKTRVEIFVVDLSDISKVKELYEKTKNEKIDLLINNAGYGIFGSFDETNLDDELNMIDVNVKALHILTKLYLKDMKKRVYQYNPSKVFLLIGTNDLIRDKSNEEIVEGVEKIIKGIKENRPKAEIYLESIYPVNHDIRRNNAGNRKNSDIKEINEKLEDYCEDNDITYIDMYDLLKDDDDNLKEEYTKDGLHLSDKGYEVVTKEIKQIIS